jgi:hypothetical protein
MRKIPRNYLMLAALLVFSFIFRVVVMLFQTYPPGADIGLHNSIIDSITQGGNTNFLWNYYHMGGGTSVTFPGYHIFTAYVILLTGMPDYIAQTVVVSAFSTIIVAVTFLLTRKIWNASAAIIAAFLMAFSRFDIEMLMWGGFPNVVTLLLIPIAFYLFLQKDKLALAPYIVVTSLICSGIFLTHSLSSVLFLAITATYAFFIVIFARKLGERRTSVLYWVLPIIVGIIIISPFLIEVAPAYIGADAKIFTGGNIIIKDAILATKTMSSNIVIPLFAFSFLYLLFSKFYLKKWLTAATLLLLLWWLVPTLMTQGYLVGVFTDYQRFLYFAILPIMMLIGVGFQHSARFIGQAVDWSLSKVQDLPQIRISKNVKLKRLLQNLQKQNWIIIFLSILLVFVLLFIPFFVSPSAAIGNPIKKQTIQSFYQVMNSPMYEAIQWAKTNTAPGSIFLTDAEYGWWFSGFGQRPTISAVSPEYLTNGREIEPAGNASLVLDTDYMMDNGLIQVREDGGYIGRHNPDFFAKLNKTYVPFGFSTFDDSAMILTFHDKNNYVSIVHMNEVPVVDQYIVSRNASASSRTSTVRDAISASVFIVKANSDFRFTVETTVTKGKAFANVTALIEAINPDIYFDTMTFTIYNKESKVVVNATLNTVAFFGVYDFVAGQLIFSGPLPMVTGSSIFDMTYNLNGTKLANMTIFSTAYEYSDPNKELKTSTPTDAQLADYYQGITNNIAAQLTKTINNLPLEIFDYKQSLDFYNVSYIALRDISQIDRFVKDPSFSLVFINEEVAIFRVNKQ